MSHKAQLIARFDGCKCVRTEVVHHAGYQMRRIIVKFSRVTELRTRGRDQQRGPAFLSPSLRVWVVMLILTALAGTPAQLGAQSVTSGDIVGVVTDPSGAILTNANVTLKSLENGSTQLSRSLSVLAVAARTLYSFRYWRRLSASQCNSRGDYRSSRYRQHFSGPWPGHFDDRGDFCRSVAANRKRRRFY